MKKNFVGRQQTATIVQCTILIYHHTPCTTSNIIILCLLIQLASIPGLEDVTVSTPAPGQPSGAAAASAAGSAPPPASDVPQPAAEVHIVSTIYCTLSFFYLFFI